MFRAPRPSTDISEMALEVFASNASEEQKS